MPVDNPSPPIEMLCADDATNISTNVSTFCMHSVSPCANPSSSSLGRSCPSCIMVFNVLNCSRRLCQPYGSVCSRLVHAFKAGCTHGPHICCNSYLPANACRSLLSFSLLQPHLRATVCLGIRRTPLHVQVSPPPPLRNGNTPPFHKRGRVSPTCPVEPMPEQHRMCSASYTQSQY